MICNYITSVQDAEHFALISRAKYKSLKKIYREKSTPIYIFQTLKNQKIRVKEYKAIAKSRMPDGLNNN